MKKCAVLASLLLPIAAASDATANGGRLQLARARAGPYVVSVWTQPAPARVGRIDVSVAVMQPSTGEPVLDAAVRLLAESLRHKGLAAGAELRRGGGGNLLLYHGEVETSEPGRWRLTIEVEGPSGRGQTALELEVLHPKPTAWWLLGAMSAVAAAILGWRWARSRHRQ
jgi:hypothetical protein